MTDRDTVLYAEQAVLGTVMLTPAALPGARRCFRSGFAEPAHRVIWAAITALDDAGLPYDPASVLHCLVDTGDIFPVGGAAYLHRLMAASFPEMTDELLKAGGQ